MEKTGRKPVAVVCATDVRTNGMNGKKLESRKNLYFKYTLCFLTTGILVFGWLVASGKSFVWNFDGVYQHFNTLVYYGK